MLFNSAIIVYQPTKSFEHGEVDSSYASTGTLYCHIKSSGHEQVSADRKKSVRRAKLFFETSPVTLVARDVVAIDGAYYHLVSTPMGRKGLSGRVIYEVDVVEDFTVVIA